ncbi:hypothetical protein [Paraburkholderia kururiensis]|uniref:Uncharacterized protein n=1 Tax=Paraburkholderia kururiensis TaxID=984307 RepID=A0ABZ0WLL7_9BURK|nr:hypothetical protein [Paraburkholderia kururiensis]WQD78240.1 hypothetical protein U0042_00545 [Paraburkholderia kururiensis]
MIFSNRGKWRLHLFQSLKGSNELPWRKRLARDTANRQTFAIIFLLRSNIPGKAAQEMLNKPQMARRTGSEARCRRVRARGGIFLRACLKATAGASRCVGRDGKPRYLTVVGIRDYSGGRRISEVAYWIKKHPQARRAFSVGTGSLH